MIIESLCDLHRTLVSDGVLPEIGFERRKLRFIVELAPDGSCLGVTDYGGSDIGRVRDPWFNVPLAMRRTSRIQPNLLWDNLEYALGVGPRQPASKAYRQAVERRHLSFCDRLRSFAESVGNDDGLAAVLRFYASGTSRRNARALIGVEHDHASATLSFRLDGDEGIVAERQGLRDAIVDTYHRSSAEGQCLVTGAFSKLARTHGLVKGLPDGHRTGTSLISFNFGAARSYGMTRAEAAPVSQAAAAAYVCALNWLLEPSNHRSLQLGRLTLLCWEDAVTSLASEASVDGPPASLEGPRPDPGSDLLIERILTALRTATRASRRPGDLCLLGLVPNVARVSVVFWRKGASIELFENLERWTRELRLANGSPRVEVLFTPTSLVQALCSTGDKSSHREAQIAMALVRAALFGERLLADTLTLALHGLKLRPQEKTELTLTGLIKMALIRNHSIPIPVGLDITTQNLPYRLGRLFAVLERLQKLAYPRVRSTVRDRFWVSSSASPSRGFRIPLQMARVYLRKLTPRPQAFFEKVLEELVSELPARSLPARLTIPEQGLFAVGYYHQRTALAGRHWEHDWDRV
jgi:CRISPR-associated protein Csd1